MQVFSSSYTNDRWEPPLPTIDSDAILGFVFADPAYFDDPTPFETLTTTYSTIKLIGCSGAGEIFKDQVQEESVVVALVTFDNARFAVIHEQLESPEDSYHVGSSIASQLLADDLQAVWIASDGLGVNGTALAAGFNEKLPPSVSLSGGLAGDGDRFDRSWVVIDDKPRTSFVSAVGLYGDSLQVTCGSEGGWQPFGPVREVTKSDNNILYEIDGKPALELYKRYLGERAEGLPATALLFPLQISDDERSLVRTILAVDEEQQSMTFAGDIPQGAQVQLMRSTLDTLIKGAEDAATNWNSQTATDALCLAVSCVGRRLVLGQDCDEEVEATYASLGDNSHQIGFYSYGELAPTGFQPCDLHNQTMTLTLLTER